MLIWRPFLSIIQVKLLVQVLFIRTGQIFKAFAYYCLLHDVLHRLIICLYPNRVTEIRITKLRDTICGYYFHFFSPRITDYDVVDSYLYNYRHASI